MGSEGRAWSDGCGGPDAFMELVFAPVDDATLVRIVGSLPLRGYVAERIDGPMGSSFADTRAVKGYVAYADTDRAESVFAHLRGTAKNAQWVYRVVTVGDSRVRFEDGYMGGDAALVASESRLAAALVVHRELVLVAWVVRSGGQGWDTTTIAEGRDGHSLLARLGRAE